MDPRVFAATRAAMQRIATHVLARRRHAATGRFGLRATPGGIGTPAFGPPDALEVVRTSGTALVHEVGGRVRVTPMAGATLAELAAIVGADLTTDLSVGRDTPAVGDPDAPVHLDPDAVAALAAWFDLGWRALDGIGPTAPAPAPIQLWPEHFDASCLVAIGPGDEERCDVGVSPGDHHHDEPYLYVSPWGSRRPGGAAYWNASFGALLPRSAVGSVDDAVTFFAEGLTRLAR